MKKITATMLIIVMVLCMMPAVSLAAEHDDGTLVYTELSDGTLSVTRLSFSFSGGALVIPSSYNGMDVTAINGYAFSFDNTITSVTIPASVTSIGEYAFFRCASLSSVTLSDGLTVIGENMFYECLVLTSVTIPASVTSIGYRAFGTCDILSSVTLKDGLTVIGENMLSNCIALTSVTIPASVTSIGDFAFAQCSSMSSAVSHSKTAAYGTDVFVDTNLSADGLYGFSGSTTQTYANSNSHPFHAFLEVTYDSQGGASVQPGYVVKSGDVLPAPADSTRLGYTFEGWHLTAACDTAPVIFPYTVTDNMTLYAKWMPIYTVTFDSQGGSAVEPQQVASGSKAAKPSDPTCAGHVFGGWYTDSELTSAWNCDTNTVTADTTLYAKWTQLTLSSSAPAGKIYAGGRITLTPSVSGGTWDWDRSFFSATFNSPATFTALKAGKSIITYTVGGVSTAYEVTIAESELPATGQDFTWVWLTGMLAILLLAVEVMVLRKKRIAE